jgi:bifunctional DNA-binding transcriptional regulator/antitoxin component of YhaV-PrlF toxin-antitoxin module
MSEEAVILRPRRQVTLPRSVCDALGLKPGDRLLLDISDGVLIGRPGRKAAREALEALRKGFADAGVTEQELLESGRKIRDELFREKYGHLLEGRKGGRGTRRST